MSWINAIKSAAQTVGKDAKTAARFARMHGGKVVKGANEFAKDSVSKSPYLTAALAGGAGLGIGSAMNQFDADEYPPELQEVIVQMRAKGASDDEIAAYLDQLMEASNE